MAGKSIFKYDVWMEFVFVESHMYFTQPFYKKCPVYSQSIILHDQFKIL